MKVAFFHTGDDVSLPTIMVASCKKAMPHVPVVFLTDPATPDIPGVDETHRELNPGIHYNPWRVIRYSDLEPGQWLLLDTDVVVQKDVSPLFDSGGFDVAMHRRDKVVISSPWPDFPELTTETFAKWMPFNTGVIFCQNKDFLEEAARRVVGYLPKWRDRWGDQIAAAWCVKSGRYKVGHLPEHFNYTPRTQNDVNQDKAFILHFKGSRKEWMRGLR